MNNGKVIILSTLISAILIALTLGVYITFFSTQVRYLKTGDVVEKYAGMKEAKIDYKKKMDAWQSNIDTLESDYRRASLKFETEKKSMSQAEKNIQYQNLAKQEMNIRAYVERIEAQAKEEDEKMTGMVINQINEFIKDYSVKHRYDIVLGTNKSGTLLYSADHLDITEDLIKELNNYYLDKK